MTSPVVPSAIGGPARGARAVGSPIDRVDARLKVTGKAVYAADVPVAQVAHAVIATSAIALGRLAGLDVAAARSAPGVLAVITRENVPPIVEQANTPGGPAPRVLQLLSDDHIHYADQPIAVVVAETLEQAQHAAALIAPRYRSERPAADLLGGIATAYAPATAGPHGPTDSARGDVATGLAAAAHTMTAVYTTPVENHNPMEPHATVAVWQGSDRLTVYDSTQGIFGCRDRLASLLGLAKDRVRVIDHFVGGGFGCKGTPWSHVVLSALAAKAVGRPVKLVITRQQMFSLVGHRSTTRQTIALGCDRNGRLTAIRHDVLSETSRFDEFVEPSAMQTRMLYACPNVTTTHRLVRLDIPTPTFMRAPGESTGTFALESAMDELAVLAGLDPLELRLRNYAELDPDTGKPFSSKSLRECYRAGAEAFGWARRVPRPRSMREGRELIGWGMATATYPTNQSPASARATLQADDARVALLVQAGTQDIGTGTYTIMTQLAADALGLPVDAVTFELGDTALPTTPISGGSMTAASVGSAVVLACKQLVRQLAALAIADPASPLYGVVPEAVEAVNGALAAAANPGKAEPFAHVLASAGKREVTGAADSPVRADTKAHSCHAFGADFVEVRVDEELGRVRVARVVGAFAAGKFLNPKTARSQLIGGIVWAIGMALEERVERDPRSARVVTRDLADYHVPVNADVGDIDIHMIDEDDPFVNEIGAKGIGEIGITGATAAIANAVYHATGKRIRDLPITVETLL